MLRITKVIALTLTGTAMMMLPGGLLAQDLNSALKLSYKEQFEAAVADAKANCPISKLLNTNITHEAKLA